MFPYGNIIELGMDRTSLFGSKMAKEPASRVEALASWAIPATGTSPEDIQGSACRPTCTVFILLRCTFIIPSCRDGIQTKDFERSASLDGLQMPDHLNRHEAAELVFFAKPIRPLITLYGDANNAVPGVQNRSSAVAAKNDRIDHKVRNLVVHLALRDRAMVNVDAVALVVSRKPSSVICWPTCG